MKFAVEQHNMEIENGGQSYDVTIANNAKTMMVVTDGIYNDPIKAIVRELSTNAWDSHRRAGKADIPFDVHLPTYDEEYFAIRDYGVGMDYKKVTEVFATLLQSDKDDSNDEAGFWGLGSKTPFAYNTRTFTLETWTEEVADINTQDTQCVHRVWYWYIGNSGMPRFNLVKEEVSDEPQGVLISLAVPSHDFDKFAGQALQIYRYFDVQPNLSENGGRCNLESIDKNLEGDRWYTTTHGKAHVVMGCVAYPINFDHPDLKTVHKYLFDCPIHVKLDIGEADVVTSRDSLRYTPKTVKNILQVFDSFENEFRSIIQNEIDACNSRWQALQQWSQIKNRIGYNFSDILHKKDFVWNGQSLEWENQAVSDALKGQGIIEFYSRYKNRGYGKIGEQRICTDISPQQCRLVLHTKECTNYKVRCKYATTQGQCTNIILVMQDQVDFIKDLLTCVDADFERDINLPIPPRSSGSRYSRGSLTRVCKWVDASNKYDAPQNEYWNTTDVDLTEGGLYVEKYRYQIKTDVGLQTPHKVATMKKYLSYFNITIPPIYGIKVKDIKLAHKRGDWQCFFTWAKQQIKERFDGTKLKQLADFKEAARHVELDRLHHLQGLIDDNHYIAKVYQSYLDLKNKVKDVPANEIEEQVRVYNYFHKPIQPNKVKPSTSIKNGVFTKYPMLVMLDKLTNFTFDAKELLYYIQGVDNA